MNNEHEDNHDERICLACSVAGCECDETISGCEGDVSDQAYAQQCIERTYAAYRDALDAPVRDADLLALSRRAYVNATKYQLSL